MQKSIFLFPFVLIVMGWLSGCATQRGNLSQDSKLGVVAEREIASTSDEVNELIKESRFCYTSTYITARRQRLMTEYRCSKGRRLLAVERIRYGHTPNIYFVKVREVEGVIDRFASHNMALLNCQGNPSYSEIMCFFRRSQR